MKLVVLVNVGIVLLMVNAGTILVFIGQRPVVYATGLGIEDELAEGVATPMSVRSMIPELVRSPI